MVENRSILDVFLLRFLYMKTQPKSVIKALTLTINFNPPLYIGGGVKVKVDCPTLKLVLFVMYTLLVVSCLINFNQL